MLTQAVVIQRACIIIVVLYSILIGLIILGSILKKKKVEWARIFSMMILYIIIIGVVIAPPVVFAIFLSILGFFAIHEIYHAATAKDAANVVGFFRFFSYVMAAAVPFVFLYFTRWIALFLIVSAIALFSYPVFTQNPFHTLDRASRALISLVFTCFLSYLILLRIQPDGIGLCFFLIYLINTTDIAAYLFGRALGKRKLAPTISGSKTLEGSACAVLSALGVGLLFHHYLIPQYPTFKIAVLSLLLGIISQLGDLIFSAFKRDVGIKDYSHIIPGQGGVLDRFDSLVISAPLFFYLLSL